MATQTDSPSCKGGDLWSNLDSLNYMTAKAQAANEPILAVMFAAARQAVVIAAHRRYRPQRPPAETVAVKTATVETVAAKSAPTQEPLSTEAVESVESVATQSAIECINLTSHPEPHASDIDSNELSVATEADAAAIAMDTDEPQITAQPIDVAIEDEFDDQLTDDAAANAPTIDMDAMPATGQSWHAGRKAGVLVVITLLSYLSAGLAGVIPLPHIASGHTRQPIQHQVPDPKPTLTIPPLPIEPKLAKTSAQEDALTAPDPVSHDKDHNDSESAEPESALSEPVDNADSHQADASVFALDDNDSPKYFATVPTLFGKDEETHAPENTDGEVVLFADQVKQWMTSSSDQSI